MFKFRRRTLQRRDWSPSSGSSKVLEVIGEAKKQVALEDKGSAVLEFQLRRLAAVGAGQVTVTREGAHVSEEKAQFPFLPAAPRSRRSVVGPWKGARPI